MGGGKKLSSLDASFLYLETPEMTMHHACIDGGAGAALTNMIYDISPVPRQVEPPAARAKVGQEPRDIAADLLDSYQQLWTQPLDAAAAARGIELPRSGKSDIGSILFD